jgi:hypothetical protein
MMPGSLVTVGFVLPIQRAIFASAVAFAFAVRLILSPWNHSDHLTKVCLTERMGACPRLNWADVGRQLADYQDYAEEL